MSAAAGRDELSTAFAIRGTPSARYTVPDDSTPGFATWNATCADRVVSVSCQSIAISGDDLIRVAAALPTCENGSLPTISVASVSPRFHRVSAANSCGLYSGYPAANETANGYPVVQVSTCDAPLHSTRPSTARKRNACDHSNAARGEMPARNFAARRAVHRRSTLHTWPLAFCANKSAQGSTTGPDVGRSSSSINSLVRDSV